jgi:hypothetical protein
VARWSAAPGHRRAALFIALPQRVTVRAATAADLGSLLLVITELLAFCSFAITDRSAVATPPTRSRRC